MEQLFHASASLAKPPPFTDLFALFRVGAFEQVACEPLLVVPAVSSIVEPASIQKPFIPVPPMTKRMCRIQKALIKQHEARRQTELNWRSRDTLSQGQKEHLIYDLHTMIHTTMFHFLNDSRTSINIRALEGRQGMAVKFAVECRNGNFEIVLQRKMPLLKRLWELVIGPKELKKLDDEGQLRIGILGDLITRFGV
jgi:hypothetical protein